MGLVTIEEVELYLGTTLDSSEEVVYQDIIDAVSKYVECYCDCSFEDGVYSERITISDREFYVRNNVQFIYAMNYGIGSVIEIVAPSVNATVEVKNGILRLVNGFTVTEIDISEKILSETVTLIGNEAGWTATLTTGVDDSYARAIYDGSFSADADMDITLVGAPCRGSVSQIAQKVFQANSYNTEGVCVYRGGYSPLPADLTDAIIRMTIQSYQDRNPSSGISGELKSEKVGDYSYTKLTASELNASIASLSINYYSVLDCYYNHNI